MDQEPKNILKLKIPLSDGEAAVYFGGQGTALLLLHGGWGGAESHFERIWNELALKYRIVAPELPGVLQGRPLQSVKAYADWAVRLLDALGIHQAWCIGNSFGAAVASSIAANHPRRVHGLILVNGGKDSTKEPIVRLIRKLPFGFKLLRWMIRYNTYSPATIRRAFANPKNAPEEVIRVVSQKDPPQLDMMVSLFLRGNLGARLPTVPTLIVWGREDHLIGVSVDTAKEFAREISGAQLAFIDGAGHLPQVEQPSEFIRILERFLVTAHTEQLRFEQRG